MVWADHGRLSLSCCIRRDVLAEARRAFGNAPAADALHRHILASCRGAREAIGNASLDGPWLAAGPIRTGIRTGYELDIFRVGNIAGESQPIIAEGITMAMQSGWLLASELAGIDPKDRSAQGDRRPALLRGVEETVLDAGPCRRGFRADCDPSAEFADHAGRRAPLSRRPHAGRETQRQDEACPGLEIVRTARPNTPRGVPRFSRPAGEIPQSGAASPGLLDDAKKGISSVRC